MMMVKDKSNQPSKPSTPSPKPSQPSEREIMEKDYSTPDKRAVNPPKESNESHKKQ
jgi:hypothetical protein